MSEEPSKLWMQAYDEAGPSRDDMWDWLEAKYIDLMFAATVLCNAHRCSYGGPETLRALAERIRGEA